MNISVANSLNLPKILIASRILRLDPFARFEFSNMCVDLLNPVIVPYVWVESSTLTSQQIIDLMAQAVTPEEQTELDDFSVAASSFDTLPDWATWTPTQATTYIHTNILNGWEQAQLDSWIDANVTSLAGARAAFKQIGASILTIRSLLENMAKAVLYLRDLIVRIRH